MHFLSVLAVVHLCNRPWWIKLHGTELLVSGCCATAWSLKAASSSGHPVRLLMQRMKAVWLGEE